MEPMKWIVNNLKELFSEAFLDQMLVVLQSSSLDSTTCNSANVPKVGYPFSDVLQKYFILMFKRMLFSEKLLLNNIVWIASVLVQFN